MAKVSPKTAYLKQTSEQRCREAFDKWCGGNIDASLKADKEWARYLLMGWEGCWQYLEGQLLKEIQS